MDSQASKDMEPSRTSLDAPSNSQSRKLEFRNNWKLWILVILVFTAVFGYATYLTYFYPNSQNGIIGKSIANELDFEVETLDDTLVSVSQFVGKPLIIDFFATWCAPCKDQVDAIKTFLQSHPDVSVVSVSVDPLDDLNKLAQYREENGITWTIGRDVGLRGSTNFDVFGLPTVVFVDQNGIVRNVESRVVPEDQLTAWYQNSQASIIKVFGLQLDVTSQLILFPLFFLIGLYVALSPCLFPIMPLTIFNLMSKQSKEVITSVSATDLGTTMPKKGTSRRKVLGWTLLLCGGILLAFALFALVGLFVGTALVQLRYELGFLLGLILIVLGAFMLVPRLEESTFARIPIPQRISEFMEKEEYSAIDLFFLGFLYSIIALPCAGPAILSTIPLVAAIANPFLTFGVLIIFGIGLFIPYLVLVLVTAESQARAIKFLQKNTRAVRVLAGILIIAMGLLFMAPLLGGPDFIYRFGL